MNPLYLPMPPVLPPPMLTQMSPERLAFNIKMLLMKDGGGTISVAPDGKTELSNLIDTISACVIEEIQRFGCVQIATDGIGIPVSVPITPVSGPTIPTILKIK